MTFQEYETQERSKYSRMWARTEYRFNSPGEGAVKRAAEALQTQKGQTLIDYGCGTGRASLLWSQRGLVVTMVDIAENALDKKARESGIPFVRACLWDLPLQLTAADWFFCCDVMEHIPEPCVSAVLKEIGKRTRLGGYFQIATTADGFGAMIGETLHMTVKPYLWWEAEIARSFEIQEKEQTGPGQCRFIVGRKHGD